MEMKYQLVDGATAPTQGYEGDVAFDTYVRETTVIVSGGLSQTKLPLGIKTEFDHDKYAVLVSPRGSFSKLPLTLANSVGLVEGTYRGEYLALVRGHLIASGVSSKFITLIDGELASISIEDALKTIPGTKEALGKAKAQFLKDSTIMNDIIGRGIPKDVEEELFVSIIPTGTIIIPKDTRLVQVWAVQKEKIEWIESTLLTHTVRGSGAVGSSGTTNNKEEGK